MHLDAGAVQLVLDAHLRAQLGERGVQVLGRAREHRPDGPAHLRRDRLQRGGASREGEPGGLGQAARQEERPADGRRGHLRRRGDRLQHHALQRAEQCLELGGAAARRAGARRGRQLVQPGFDVRDLQAGGGRGRHLQTGERAPARTEPAASQSPASRIEV